MTTKTSRTGAALRVALAALLLTEGASADPRARAGDEHALWSQSVLRMETSVSKLTDGARRHYLEHCTATLVPGGDKPLLVTAWHCIEGQSDLTRPPRVELRGDWLPARVLATGGSMQDDWAVIALMSAPDTLPSTMPIGDGLLNSGDVITAAGYSRDPDLGSEGEYLTYHADCKIQQASPAGASSNCLAYRGASGGPVIRFDATGKAQLVGVISAGDSRSQSVLVPLSRFRARLVALQ